MTADVDYEGNWLALSPICHCSTVWCWIDDAIHRLGITWHYACDKHEAHIRGRPLR